MKKIYSFLICFLFLNTMAICQKSIYDFKMENLFGEIVDLDQYKGYNILIVNTASKCGFTPQYDELQQLYDKYKDDKFVVLGFPSNDFLKQEPGTNSEIAEFCKLNYGVTFPMMGKVHVKGEEQCELFKYLTDKSLNQFSDEKVKWNFQKFLINREGKLELVVSPKTSPLDSSIQNWIVKNK